MSQSHALQNHIAQLQEIRSILNAMKNLAFMEIHKLTRLQTMQSKLLHNIEQAASDFMHFYPEFTVCGNRGRHIGIVIGSERGFCGDLNESLIDTLEKEQFSEVVAVGNRLINKLTSDNAAIARGIPGANIAEDVPAVIHSLIESLNAHVRNDNAETIVDAGIRLTAVYHETETGKASRRELFPPAYVTETASRYRYPPLLNLDAGEFYAELIHYYLFAALHGIFYDALSAENHSRLQHLDGAVKHLDDDTVSLHRKLQTYRQEEITEEIEVILLNSETVGMDTVFS